MGRRGRKPDPRGISSKPRSIKFDERTAAILEEDLQAMRDRGITPNASEVVRRWARVSSEARLQEFVGELLDESRVGHEAMQEVLESNERLQAKVLQYERREQARRSKERRRLLDLILKPDHKDRYIGILREYAAQEAGGFRAPCGIKLLDQARDELANGSWQELLDLVQDEEDDHGK